MKPILPEGDATRMNMVMIVEGRTEEEEEGPTKEEEDEGRRKRTKEGRIRSEAAARNLFSRRRSHTDDNDGE